MLSRSIASLALFTLTLTSALAAPAESFEFSSPSAVTKGADLRGRIVETRDGEELGRVQDFALDLASGRVAYVVVSVGSFLIQDSLIAVAPDALRESADPDGRLVLEADAASLRDAERFSERGNWPVRADVVAAAGERAPAAAEDAGADAAADADDGRPKRGTATISDGNRTATLSGGERSIRIESRDDGSAKAGNGSAGAGRGAPANRFERLDEDGDGVLNRAEIAHELTRDDSFTAIDRDGSGDIDPDEFAAWRERPQAPEGPAPSD